MTQKDVTRIGLSGKARAPEYQTPSRYTGKYYAFFEETFEYQIDIHLAHTLMLAEQGIITAPDAEKILSGIVRLEARYERSPSSVPYLAFETTLVDEIGPIGSQMHVGRSRDDLANAHNRMYYRQKIADLIEALTAFRARLLDKARDTTNIVTAAYTHSRQAQPITFGHYLLAHAEAMGRHVERYEDLDCRINLNPLGSVASAGTTWPLDRERTAELLGFDGIVVNTLEGVAGWSHIAEFASANAIMMADLARLANDLIEWQTDEFSLIEIDSSFTGGSSVMPHKKNPYVLEGIKALAAGALADHTGILTSLLALPYQHISARHVLQPASIEAVESSVEAMAGVIATLEPKRLQMQANVASSFMLMTSLADELVTLLGISFRQAHDVAAEVVVRLHETDAPGGSVDVRILHAAVMDVLGQPCDIEQATLDAIFDPLEHVRKLDVIGGPSQRRTAEHIALMAADVDEAKARNERRTKRVSDAKTKLWQQVNAFCAAHDAAGSSLQTPTG